MSASFFDEVLFNDGEGLDYNDLNNIARAAKAGLYDGVLGPQWMYDLQANAGFIYAVNGDNSITCVPTFVHGIPKPGASPREITCGPGTIFQCVSLGGGTTQGFLPYQLGDNEISEIVDIGHATDPRIDLVAIRLTPTAGTPTARDFKDATTGVITSTSPNKTTRPVLSVQLVKGTPAGSPTKPAVPSGYAAWCYVYVPATFNTTFTATTHFIDVRLPMRTSSVFIPANLFAGAPPATGSGSLSTGIDGSVTDTAGGAILRAACPAGFHQRILGVVFEGALTGGFSLVLKRRDYTTTLIGETDLSTGMVPSNNFAISSLSGGGGLLFSTRDALWGNGYSSPQGATFVNCRTGLGVAATTGNVGDKWRGVRYLLAG